MEECVRIDGIDRGIDGVREIVRHICGTEYCGARKVCRALCGGSVYIV